MPQIQITVDINESTFLKNPIETSLGKRILEHGIHLFYELGYENFNFKKLSERVGSPEASIYRYFENKYKLLTYLVAWYWDFMHYMVLLDTRNIENPKQRLRLAVKTIVYTLHDQEVPHYINQELLHQIVITNASRVYQTAKVDELKEKGFYNNYKKLNSTFAKMILAVDNEFEYPKALATNIIELAISNEYYLDHLPELTDFEQTSGEAARKHTYEMVTYYLKKMGLD